MSTLAFGATGCSHDAPIADSAGAPGSAARPKAPSGSRPDTWQTTADSVVTRYLTLHRFGADSTAETTSLDDCDGGSDGPTLGVGMAGFRILGRTPTAVDPAPDNGFGPLRTITYSLELKSVAHLIPAGDLGNDSLPPAGAPRPFEYLAEVGPRVDTVSLIIGQTVSKPDHWWVCDLHHDKDRYTPYWDFIAHAETSAMPIKWQPAGTSWADIRRLADSIGRR